MGNTNSVEPYDAYVVKNKKGKVDMNVFITKVIDQFRENEIRIRNLEIQVKKLKGQQTEFIKTSPIVKNKKI